MRELREDGGSAASRVDRRAICVCVPARDEEERLPRLLAALAAQSLPGSIKVAICLNNTSDRSAEVIEEAQKRHRGRLDIRCEIRAFPAALAHAGSARAAAMALGLDGLAPDAVLVTTDADTRPPPGWLAANLAAIRTGDEIVGGRLVLDEEESLSPELLEGRRLWDRYWDAVRRIEDEVDPDPYDPPPRHGDHTGASLAMSVDLYLRAGGVPLLPTGEDRALVAAAQAAGGRLMHPASVWTRVSARRDGRAAGGMAEMMRAMEETARRGERLTAPALSHWRERASWRRAMRERRLSVAELLAAESALPPMPHDADLATIGAAS